MVKISIKILRKIVRFVIHGSSKEAKNKYTRI
jgi:hypothetical protein